MSLLMACFLLLMSSCESGSAVESSMAISGHLSSIGDSANNIDNYVVLATERGDFSLLKPIGEETESIRSKTQEVKQAVTRLMEEKAKLEQEIKSEVKSVWITFIYKIAPLVIGAVCLFAGRFLTRDPLDTYFGLAMLIGGFVIHLFIDAIGNTGVMIMGIGITFWIFYSQQKKSLDKQLKSTRIDSTSSEETLAGAST